MATLFTIKNVAFAEKENNGNGNKLRITNNLNKQLNDKEIEKRGLGIGVNGDQPSVVLRPNGDYRVTGVTVNSVSSSTNTLNVSLFGFSKDVNISGAKIFAKGGGAITINDIKVGDKLISIGNYNSSTKVITVNEIRDISITKAGNDSAIQQRIQQLLEMIKKLRDQIGGSR